MTTRIEEGDIVEYHKSDMGTWTKSDFCWVVNKTKGTEWDIMCEDIPKGEKIIDHR